MAGGEPGNNDVLTRQLLKYASNEFDLESIHTLALSRRNFSDISAISECTGMERLDLSCNNITRLHALSTLTSLLTLDLSANRITTLDGLNTLDKLERLDLAGNLIGNFNALRPLNSLTNLKHLRLKDPLSNLTNPICNRQSYKDDILDVLPRLISLDGEILRGPDAEVFKMMSALESQLDCGSNRNGPTKLTPPPPKIPEDIFTTNWRNAETDDFAEQQFKAGLMECKQLNNRSSKLVEEARRKLRQTEKV